MNHHDMPRFALLMTTLGEIYGKEITELVTEIFWDTLQDFKLNQVERAIKKYASDPDGERKMPKPGDLVAWINGSPKNRALLAWSKVMNAIREVGAYESVVFEDTLIHAVVNAMGGWVKLCQTKNEELPFLAREFQQYYLAFLREPPEQVPTQVYGILPNSPPKFIGHASNTHLALGHASLSLMSLDEMDKKNKTEETG